MSEVMLFCGAVQEVTCLRCPLRQLGEASLEAVVQPGVTPPEVGAALGTALQMLDGPEGLIALDRSDEFAVSDEEAVDAVTFAVGAEVGRSYREHLEAGDDHDTTEEVLYHAENVMRELEPEYLKYLAVPKVPGSPANAAEACADRLCQCVQAKLEGTCASVVDISELFIDIVPRDRELGASTLEQLVRYGSDAEVFAMVERLRDTIVDILTPKEGPVLEGGFDMDSIDSADARRRLMIVVDILRHPKKLSSED